MPGYTKAFSREAVKWDSVRLGLDAVTLAANRTSNPIDVTGCNQFKIDVERTANSAMATSFYFETSFDKGTTWTRNVTRAISGGTETLSVHTIQAASTISAFNYYFALFGEEAWMRITFVSTGDAGDIITANVTLGVSG